MATTLLVDGDINDPEKAMRIQELSEVAEDTFAHIARVWEREWDAEWDKEILICLQVPADRTVLNPA